MANSEPRHTSRSKPLKTPMILSPKRCTNRDVGMASCFGCFGCLVMRTSDGPKGRDAMSTSGSASRSFISCTPSTTYLRQLLEPPSKCTIHWDRAYWNRLTNNAWLRNCLCERSLSNDKNRCLSIARELHWTWLSPGFSGGGNGPGGSQSDRCAAAHPPGPVAQLSKAWPVETRTIDQLSCSFTARGYQARRAWPRRIDGNIASKDG